MTNDTPGELIAHLVLESIQGLAIDDSTYELIKKAMAKEFDQYEEERTG
jgi:hypothetical protein|tara:strand:+ start:2322 stop:2468 length:147 start_codon:yes stop_codon:yes gene_type:complete